MRQRPCKQVMGVCPVHDLVLEIIVRSAWRVLRAPGDSGELVVVVEVDVASTLRVGVGGGLQGRGRPARPCPTVRHTPRRRPWPVAASPVG